MAQERTTADRIIDELGGTSVVAKMTFSPVSTVHSWRKNGIPPSRLAHIKLAAQAQHLPVPAELEAALAEHQQAAAA
jgi:hypothetical protein